MVDLTDREKALLITALVAWYSEGCVIPIRPKLYDGDVEDADFRQLFDKLGARDSAYSRVQIERRAT